MDDGERGEEVTHGLMLGPVIGPAVAPRRRLRWMIRDKPSIVTIARAPIAATIALRLIADDGRDS
ncbi:MAG: hypothetical protein ACRDGV_09090 [Candidatus Limnocylindria bacterium]